MHRLIQTNRVASVATLAAVLALTAACGSSSSGNGSSKPTAPPATKGSANVLNSYQNAGDADWVKTLDPALVTDSVSIYDINMVNANLVKTDYPSLQPKADLASSWTASPDHKTYTFHLRMNAKFSNGDPVTAQDAAWSITRSLLPATKSPVATTYLGQIVGALDVANKKATTVSGVKALDAHTLQIKLLQPVAYFLGALSYPTADVLDKKAMQGKAPGAYLTNTCSGNVGAGPFKFVCVNSGSGRNSFYQSGHSATMKFAPNPYYYGAKPKVTVNAPMIADTETNWRLYQAGGVVDTGVPTADLASAKGQPGFTETPLLSTDYITPNQKTTPFNNINCRLAVAYAIDRVNITTKLLQGTEAPSFDVLPKGLPNGGQGFFADHNGVPYYDPTKAKQYLNNCPGKLQNVNLTFQQTSQDIVHEYDAVRANLQAIGANITLQPKTFNAWLTIVGQTMQATHTAITENLWIDDYPDSQDWLENLLVTGANYDIGGFSNAQYDALVKQSNTTFDNAKRASLNVQAQKIALNNGAWIMIGYQVQPYIINPKVHGLIPTPSQIQPLHNDWSLVTVSK
ncbi:MAG: peptide ABC transporter substrate-binding protein [Chloroflexota bacterium]